MRNKKEKYKNSIALSLLNIFILIIIFAVIIIMGLWNNTYKNMFPHLKTVFSTSSDIIEFTVGKEKYNIPKAYLYWPSDFKGGDKSGMRLKASIKDGMIPWTLSNNYKNRIEDNEDLIYLQIDKGFYEPYIREELIRMEKSYKNSFPDRWQEMNYGIYKDIFRRYDRLGKKTNTDKIGKGSNFFLIPIITNQNPFQIKCTMSANNNPNHLCTVMTISADNIAYSFKIPFGIIHKYKEWDKHVIKLINRLRENKG